MSDAIKLLIGRRLTSVEFVHDYLQLRFDGPTLTVNGPIDVRRNASCVSNPSMNFRGAIVDVIGTEVSGGDCIIDDRIRIEFSDRSQIVISLKPEEQVNPEAAILTGVDDNIYVW